MDLEYFEKRVMSLEATLHRLQRDVADAHGVAGRIVTDYREWMQKETPAKDQMFARLDQLKAKGSPRCVYAKTIMLEYGISRTRSYQLVREYLTKMAMVAA